MRRLVIILFLVSTCYGDVYTSHQTPIADSSLDIGSAILLWRYIYGDAFTDGTALWAGSELSGFTSISGIILTDGTFITTGGIITGATWNGVAIDISDYTNLVGGTNITLVNDTLNVDDAFLINDGDDTTTGTVTAAGFTTVGTVDTGILIVDTDTLVSNVAGYENRVGIGTATPGDVATVKLQITGTDSSTAGPHVAFETGADIYPLMQFLGYSHDSVSIVFDAYWDGTWKSSDAGSNARIHKYLDDLRFRYDNGVAQGGDITWEDAMVIELTTGHVGIGGAFFPDATLQVVGDTFLGADATHYTSFTNRGAIEMHGDARVYRHMVIGAVSWKIGAGAPTASFENIYPTLTFADGRDDAAHYGTWVPYRWDDTTDMTVAIHWRHDTVAKTGKVLWNLNYIGAKEGEHPVGAGTLISELSAGNHPQDEILVTTFGTNMLAVNLERMDDLGLKVWRNGDDGTDLLTEGAELIAVHIHFTMNQLGDPLLTPVTDVLLLDDGASKLLLDDGASFMLIRI